MKAAAVVVLCGFAAFSSVGQGTRGQKPTPVWLHVTVTDAQGKLVMGLLREQFIVEQAGREVPIDELIRDEHPVAMSLMLDSSGSMSNALADVARAADALVSQFIPGDRVNIGTFAMGVTQGRRFTANPRLIRDGIRDGLFGGEITCQLPSQTAMSNQQPPTIPVFGGQVILGGQPLTRQTGGARAGGTWLWDAVECGVQVVVSDEEAFRRVLVLITDGMAQGGYATQLSALHRANAEGVMVYAAGLSGSQGANAGVLRGFTQATGGWSVMLNHGEDFTPVFKRMGEELHNQYVMSIMSTAASSEPITVRARNPTYKVRSQRGHVATPR